MWGNGTYCGGTTFWTFNAEQSFNVTFLGVDVYVFGTYGQEGGETAFVVDGQDQAISNRYTPGTDQYNCSDLIYSSSGLTNATHTLTATFIGNSPQNGTSAAYFEWQYLMYTMLDPTDIPTPTPTPTPTPQPIAPKHPTSHTAAIAGGIGGGIGGLLALTLLVVRCRRRTNVRTGAALDLGSRGGEIPGTPWVAAPFSPMSENAGRHPMISEPPRLATAPTTASTVRPFDAYSRSSYMSSQPPPNLPAYPAEKE